MQSKRILITTNQLHRFGGSEMVVLELAEEFCARGWYVDIYTNFVGEPFISEFAALPRSQVRISDETDSYAGEFYDLAWIQHSLLPPALLKGMAEGTEMLPVSIWNHMSQHVPLEFPLLGGIEGELASRILFVSPEARDALREFGLPPQKLELFQNPAPKNFSAGPPPPLRSQLNRVAVVSNHPPQELLEALAVLESRGVIVEKIGGAEPKRVTPSVLDNADAVVTIGKTVQYALTAGLPVYCYDHFGGCGWISEENLEAEYETNFSGRTTRRKLSADGIASELKNGFAQAAEFARTHRDEHTQQFGLSDRIDGLLESLEHERPKLVAPEYALQWSAIIELVRSFYRVNVASELRELKSCRSIAELRASLETQTAAFVEVQSELDNLLHKRMLRVFERFGRRS